MNNSFAVIFDMDGVLIDSNPYHKIALLQFCEEHGKHLTEEDLQHKVYGRTNKDWLTNVFGQLSPVVLEQYTQEKEGLYRKLHENDVEPVKGLIQFLEKLEAESISKVIATSAPRANVDFILEKTGIGKYFSTILHDTHVTVGKPHPEIYLKAITETGLPATQCIVIEDSISGIKAGKAAGAKVIGITTTHSAEEMRETDLVIGDFDDLSMEKLRRLII